MNFEVFDFSDFRIPTPLSTDQDDVEASPQIPLIIHQDVFTADSSSDAEDENDGSTSSCASTAHFRARSHSTAFLGDSDIFRSVPFLQQQLGGANVGAVHLSRVFDPTGAVHDRTRRSSICTLPRSSSEPASPIKIRSCCSIGEHQDSRLRSPNISSEETDFLDVPFNTLRRHSVAAASLELFKCSWEGCGKMFSRRYNLDTHLRIHTGEKPFACSYCSVSFARNHDLRRHERIHIPEKEYACSQCCKKFSRQDALRRHERSNTCSVVNDSSSSSSSNSNNNTCEQCTDDDSSS